jgi:predicted MPP superfamily phosphohydrolase
MISRRTFFRTTAGLLTAGAGGAAWGFGVEPILMLGVREWSAAPASWPADAPPLKIAILSDIHAFEPYMPAARIARIVERINGLGADMIVLLGDYVCTSGQEFVIRNVPVAEWTAALAPLRAPLGVYAVLGNHDWRLDAGAVRTGLELAGVPVLENRALKIEKNGHAFWLVGLGDQLAHADDLSGALAQISSDDPAIALAHEPDIFPQIPERVALTLSGHTHGGQVSLPFYGPPFTGSKYGQRYVYGHVVEGGRHLVVSSGVGVSWCPVRFMAPPEITVVTVAPRPIV